MHSVRKLHISILASLPPESGEHSFTWSDPSVCNGMYECLVRMNGTVDDRSSTVQGAGIIVLR